MSQKVLVKNSPYYLPSAVQKTVVSYARCYGEWKKKPECYREQMEPVEQAALEADGDHPELLMKIITEGKTYVAVELEYGYSPLPWDRFYENRRKAYHVLAKRLGLWKQ